MIQPIKSNIDYRFIQVCKWSLFLISLMITYIKTAFYDSESIYIPWALIFLRIWISCWNQTMLPVLMHKLTSFWDMGCWNIMILVGVANIRLILLREFNFFTRSGSNSTKKTRARICDNPAIGPCPLLRFNLASLWPYACPDHPHLCHTVCLCSRMAEEDWRTSLLWLLPCHLSVSFKMTRLDQYRRPSWHSTQQLAIKSRNMPRPRPTFPLSLGNTP